MADKKGVKINVSKDNMEAKYSDFAVVAKNALGFNLDFGQRVPGGKQINIVSRIAMSPQHAKLLLRILKRNVEKYEEDFGEINLPDSAKKVKDSGVIHFAKRDE